MKKGRVKPIVYFFISQHPDHILFLIGYLLIAYNNYNNAIAYILLKKQQTKQLL